MHAWRRSVSAGPIHLHPCAELAERVLLPGDPGRALLLAQSVLDKPIMFNHYRGLWGYTGTAPDGEPLSVQSTGMGAPSAAIVISELADLGARTLIRVGTCGGLGPGLSLGDLVVATEALPFDGVSTMLSDSEAPLTPDPDLGQALTGAGEARAVRVVSTDLFYDTPPDEHERWLRAGGQVVDMETAALYLLARRRGLRAASLLLVTDLLGPERTRIAHEALPDHERRLGDVALRALLS